MLPEPPPANSPMRVTGIVKWYSPEKGFGFVQSGDVNADILLHRSVLVEAGHGDVGAGASVVCEVVRKVKGYQCTRVLSVTGGMVQPPPARSGGRRRERGQPGGWRVRAWLKSFSHETGRGTLSVFDADGDLEFVQLIAISAVKRGEEAYVSRDVFAEAGIADASVGQVFVCEIVREPGGAKCIRVLGVERRM